MVADGLVRQAFVAADGLVRQECQCVWYRCVGMYSGRFCLVTLYSSFWGRHPGCDCPLDI